MTGRTSNTPRRANRAAAANEWKRESGTVRKQTGRPQQCPPPQIDSSQRLPRPGAGEQAEASKSGRAGERGQGERKRISHIYIGAGGRYAFILFNRNRRTGKQRSPTEYVLMDGVDEKKSPPPLPKKGKNTGADEGKHPQALPGRSKTVDRENQRNQPTHHR